MKTLIVYYSLEGNTDYAAQKIAEAAGADTLRLHPKKAYKDKGLAKFLWGGKSAMMAEAPELEPYEIDLAQYDRIVFGFPVWAGKMTPPIRSFVQAEKEALTGKKIAAFACQSGRGGEKALKGLEELLGSSLAPTAIFIDPKDKQSADTDLAIQVFCKRLEG